MENHCRNEKRDTDNLKLHGLSFQLNGADLEVDSNSTDVALRVGVVSESQKEARLMYGEHRACKSVRVTYLANPRVANEEELEEEIVLAGMHVVEVEGG